MNKKILVPALALSIMGGGIAGSLLNGSAFAANSSQTNGEDVSDDQEENGEVPDQEEQKQLKQEATITEEESKALALKEMEGNITDTELEDEDGVIVYSVEVTDPKGIKHDVKVNAKSGKVYKVEADEEDEHEGDDD